MSNCKNLREQRGKIAKQMADLVKSAKNENRSLTGEEQETFDHLDNEQTRLKTEADGFERMEKFETLLLEETSNSKPYQHKPSVNRSNALRGWLLRGENTAFNRSCEVLGINPSCNSFPLHLSGCGRNKLYLRDLGTETAGAGPELVQTTLADYFFAGLVAHGGVFAVANQIFTNDYSPIEVGVASDSGAGEWLDEVDDAADNDDPSFATVTLNAWRCGSKVVPVSKKLIASSSFPIEEKLGEILSQRVGVLTSTAFAKGSGVKQPKGFTVDATIGVTAASATAIILDEVYELFYSVSAAFRNSPNACWMLSDGAAKQIRKLLDTNGRPIWDIAGSVVGGSPDTLLGKPVYIDYSLDNPASTKLTAAFGDFKAAYTIRVVDPISILTSDQVYWKRQAVGVMTEMYVDGRTTNANAVKTLKMAT